MIFEHISNHIGTHHPRTCSINYLTNLDFPFTEDEVKQTIFNAPKEKAPGPDGYIGKFFTSCWEIINCDLLASINHFYNLNQQELHLLNQAFVVLIPKKDNPCSVSDYTPISWVHSFAKLVSKNLANRLAPVLPTLISLNQSAVIKNM